MPDTPSKFSLNANGFFPTKEIEMSEKYSGICRITKSELTTLYLSISYNEQNEKFSLAIMKTFPLFPTDVLQSKRTESALTLICSYC